MKADVLFAKSLGVFSLAVLLSLTGIQPTDATMPAAREPTSALGLASLLASKKLGCTDFHSETLSPPTRAGVTLPVQLQQLVDILAAASTGACTIDHQETLLVTFANGSSRMKFETILSGLGCVLASVLRLNLGPTTTTTPGAAPLPTKISLAELGSRSIVFSTGTKTTTGTQPVNLAHANLMARRIAKTTKGNLKTFELQCH